MCNEYGTAPPPLPEYTAAVQSGESASGGVAVNIESLWRAMEWTESGSTRLPGCLLTRGRGGEPLAFSSVWVCSRRTRLSWPVPAKEWGTAGAAARDTSKIPARDIVMENATPAARQIRAPASLDFSALMAPVAATANAARISAFMILVAQAGPWRSFAALGRSWTSVRVKSRVQIPRAADTTVRIPVPA